VNFMDEKELLDKGRDFYKKGNFKAALEVLLDLIEVDGKNTEGFFLLGNIFHQRGEIGKAIKAFQKTLELDPNHTDAAISLSVVYNDIGKYEEGQKIFSKAQERVKSKNQGVDPHINKKFSQRHYELAEFYMTYQRYDEALFEYNKAIQLDRDNLEARIKIAKVYAKKGFTNKAIEELKTLKNEHPTYIPGFLALGVLHYGNGNVLDAQSEWEKVLSKEPFNKQAAMYLNLSKTATETSL
jgi:tetratricopeptide (TPR) repeat protein